MSDTKGLEERLREHDLKTWPEYFIEVIANRKPFEIRFNDRDYQVGDVLRLREWAPTLGEYTGRETRQFVTFVLAGGRFGIDPDHVVMAIKPIEAVEALSLARREREEMEAALRPFAAYTVALNEWGFDDNVTLREIFPVRAGQPIVGDCRRAAQALSAPSSPSPQEVSAVPDSCDACGRPSEAFYNCFRRKEDCPIRSAPLLGPQHDASPREVGEVELLRTAMFNAINETNRLVRGDTNYTKQALQEEVAKIGKRLTDAYNASASPREEELAEHLHYANGVADLAMKHRDIAEAALEEEQER